MVKKIRGTKPGSKTTGATPIQATKTVQSGKIGGVDKVKATEKQSSSGKIMAPTTELSPEMRERIMRIIDEEADKMFGDDRNSEDQKKTVKGAVKMAIDGGIVEGEDS